MFYADDVIDIYKRLAAQNIPVWLTGGWGIDALLGDQTRSHKDLDVLMLLDDIERMCELLAGEGYCLKELWSENRWVVDAFENKIATAFVLGDSVSRELDVHAIRLDEQGNGIPQWEETDGFIFEAQSLAGQGVIAEFPVQCISPAMQMRCHLGYELPEKQQRDLQLLHEKFGVEYPTEYPFNKSAES